VRLERLMLARGWATSEELAGIRDGIRSEVDAAIEWAEQSPYPEASELLDNVYDKR